ncbi:MAG: ABC transporter ATP-binding protein [Deltaproteobacteria bacterium]|nr:ABC transporter ATP-binding protein [Deltaproteobacteria bacterium]
MSLKPILDAAEICFRYQPGTPVLRGIDFQASIGQFTCILGPNGCGKTTLLKCLMNQLRLEKGRIDLDGRSIDGYSPSELAKYMAYVPHLPQSAFAFSVTEVVLMGRYAHTGLLGMTDDRDLKIAAEAMKMTQTRAFSDRTLDELSGGEAQRVMIARALAQQPRVMLLDEPTSHLDIRNQLIIHEMMTRVAHDWPMGVICVSHDINLAARFADRMVLMHEGRVVAAGTPLEVIDKDVLEKTYQVQVELIDSGRAEPMVQVIRHR